MHFLEYIHPETNPPVDSVAFTIPITGSLRRPLFMVAERLTDQRSIRRYTFPGGGIEVGERPKRAARREIREESGLIVNEEELMSAQRIPSIARWGDCFHKVYMYYMFLDRRKMKPQHTEEKLSDWFFLTKRELFQSIRDLRFPDFLIQPEWLSIVQDMPYW